MSSRNGALVLDPNVPTTDPSNGTTISVSSAGALQVSVGGTAPVAVIGSGSIPNTALGPTVVLPKQGTNLTDTSTQTINPASDAASEYQILTLSQNGALTLGVSGSPVASEIVVIVRRDTSAHTYAVKDDAGTTLATFGASPATAQAMSFTYNSSTSHYVFLNFFRVQ